MYDNIWKEKKRNKIIYFFKIIIIILFLFCEKINEKEKIKLFMVYNLMFNKIREIISSFVVF